MITLWLIINGRCLMRGALGCCWGMQILRADCALRSRRKKFSGTDLQSAGAVDAIG